MIRTAVEGATENVHAIKSLCILLGSVFLAGFGNAASRVACFLSENEPIIKATTIGLQWLAWGGASAVALVTVIKFLQENGIIPKRTKK